jgi:hypothetical protein
VGETRILLDSPEPRLRHVINRVRAKKFWARGPRVARLRAKKFWARGPRVATYVIYRPNYFALK